MKVISIVINNDTFLVGKVKLKSSKLMNIITRHKITFQKSQIIILYKSIHNLISKSLINIKLHQNDSNINDVSNNSVFLRKVNKKFSENGNREIKIIYSDEYFNENIFKQLSLNVFKMCMVFLLYLGTVFAEETASLE
mgnify:CR=1 FL=1